MTDRAPTAAEGATALAWGAGLLVREDRATFDATGRDRVAYLHRMLTQDVARLKPGEAAYACLLTPNGRIVSDLLLWQEGDRLVLDLPRAGAAAAMAVLERYVIADDVAFTDVSAATGRFVLAGPRAGEALARRGVVPPASGAFHQARLGGAPVRLLRRDLGVRPAYEGMLAAADLPAAVAALRDVPGVLLVDEAAYEVARVEEGVPGFGRELDERVIPNEARLDVALSFSKGCYPGQEPVVMARHRGHPPTLLVSLAVEATEPPAPGTALLEEGRPVGRVTSAVRAVAFPGIRALGFVRHAAARLGACLALEGGGRARILPQDAPSPDPSLEEPS